MSGMQPEVRRSLESQEVGIRGIGHSGEEIGSFEPVETVEGQFVFVGPCPKTIRSSQSRTTYELTRRCALLR